MNLEKPLNVRFKILMLGQGTVGKTTFKNHFLTGHFTTGYTATIGADFASHTMDYNGQTVIMSIWDMAGQKGQSSIRKSFYRGANGALLLYDVTKLETFTALEPIWLKELEETLNVKIPILILANKIDLVESRVISTEEGQKFIDKIRDLHWLTEYVETSALNGANVNESFKKLVELMIEEYGKK